MPIWSEILKEVNAAGNADPIRRKYLAALSARTKRDTILYATAWMQPQAPSPVGIPSSLLSICDEDMEGLMEVVHGLSGPNLDLILHTPGGSIEAAEAIVNYLRTKFTHIRVIVPMAAMSAGTIIACAANQIVMGKHSSLGPIDPQLQIGGTFVPAQAILDQFELAKEECSDPKKLTAWLPMLGQYGPALLVMCKNQTALSSSLVGEWLRRYMFEGKAELRDKANEIAAWLADHGEFKTHGRHIPRSLAISKGLVVDPLEDDQEFQDLVLSAFHATMITFQGSTSNTKKIIENNAEKAWIRNFGQVQLPAAIGGLQLLFPQPPIQPQAPPELAPQQP